MAEATDESPLNEIKEVFNEVIDLLNQPNLPVVINEEKKPEAAPGAPSE